MNKTFPEHNNEQPLVGIHDPSRCEGRPCPFHNMSNHGLRHLKQYWRADISIMERICEHGWGHPDPDSPWEKDSDQWIHSCDGCCSMEMESGDGDTDEGVIVVRDMFDPEVHIAMKTFIDENIKSLPLVDDREMFNRHYAHNVPFFVDIHRQLAGYASELFGEELIPSYSFLSMYNDAGICPLHLDRPQCYRTIDYLISQEVEHDWPIRIGRYMSDDEVHELHHENMSFVKDLEQASEIMEKESWTEVVLSPNDAVCYSGTNSWHYRPRPSVGRVDLVFFHFVKDGFQGALN